MNNDKLADYGIDENYRGEVVLPSENGNTHVKMSFRQFEQLAQRAYSAKSLNAIADTDGLKIQSRPPVCDTPFEDISPIFHITLTFCPKNIDFETFVSSSESDRLYDRLLQWAGNVSPGYSGRLSGARTAFVGEFNRRISNSGRDVMTSHIFVGTSIFYNDYRLSTNYPCSPEEVAIMLGGLFNDLAHEFDIAIEITSDDE